MTAGELQAKLVRDFEADAARRTAAVVEQRRAWGIESVPTPGVPFVFAARDRPRIAAACGAVTDAIERLVAESPREGLAALDCGYPGVLANTRLDASYEPRTGALAFLECQAGDPSAIGWNDALARGLALPELIHPALAALLRDRFTRWGGTAPELVFACARDSFIRSDFACLCRLFAESGWPARLVDPRDALFERGELRWAGERATLVVRDTIDEYADPLAGALPEAVRAGAVCVVNPFAAALADAKTLFEPLSSRDWLARLPAAQARLVAESVPWTRRLTERRTDAGDGTIDLVPWVLAHRAELVLKPSDGYGGSGVTLGNELDDRGWLRAIDAALADARAWVVQRFVPLPRLLLPRIGAGGFEGIAPAFVSSSFWVHDGGLVGAFARAGATGVVNVHRGGSFGPALFA